MRRNDKLSNVAVLVANYPRPKAINSCVERVETRRDLLLAFGLIVHADVTTTTTPAVIDNASATPDRIVSP